MNSTHFGWSRSTLLHNDLPEEVQSYITIIGGELYDLKQGRAAGQALLVSALGAATLFLNYKGCLGTPSIWSDAGSVLLLVVPWFFYRYQWNKNAEEYMPSEAPWRATEEAIRQEWELNYLADSRRTVMQRPWLSSPTSRQFHLQCLCRGEAGAYRGA